MRLQEKQILQELLSNFLLNKFLKVNLSRSISACNVISENDRNCCSHLSVASSSVNPMNNIDINIAQAL